VPLFVIDIQSIELSPVPTAKDVIDGPFTDAEGLSEFATIALLVELVVAQ
jgi:hypothetical protein